jgi:two-component system response regulator HydG
VNDLLRILVVDDDPDTARSIADALRPPQFSCDIAASGTAALVTCTQQTFDVVLTDLHMEGIDGIELVRRMKRLRPNLPVLVVTGDASIPRAVEAVKSGAYEYVTRPFEADELRQIVERAAATRPVSNRPPPMSVLPAGTEEIVGSGPAMNDLRDRIVLVASAQAPVLVLGETGTGKELVARALHACSPRRSRPFVTVNTSAIPETLLESQMFGHVRGAFTGAAQAHRGLFMEADGGTLLLDEIGDMPFPLQAKLLRVLQCGEIRAVGAERVQQVDVRIVAATHRRLPDLVRDGRFREDLYYRLNVVSLVVPPLRERAEDIPALARCFLARARARAPESPAESISDELMTMLCEAQFPGNVRELESLVERLVVLATHAELTPGDLAHAELDEPAEPRREPSDPSLDVIIRNHVESTLARAEGNKVRAAKMLGVDLSTLYRWQRKWKE